MPSLITFAARRWRTSPFVLMIALTCPLTVVSATPAPALSAPPDFFDEAHVEQGCFISTFVYLRRFSAAHPGEPVRTVAIHPRNFPGAHTIALVGWGGRWWGRDEDSGVFALDLPVGTGEITAAVARKAEARFELHANRSALKRGYDPKKVPRPIMDRARRAHDVAVAATILPVASERFTVKCGAQEHPMLFFRPAPHEIALYDPATGTATAETGRPGSTELVAAVARLMGYRVDHVVREFSAPTPTLVNSNRTIIDRHTDFSAVTTAQNSSDRPATP